MKNKKRIVRVLENAIALYVMFAGLWTICYLVSEILEKLGVA